jgi:SAM-dependent methyltransferase
LIWERLDGGRITAIDRSPIMARRAAERNVEHVATGRAAVHQQGELTDLELPARSFSKIFAINVNLFWARSPAQELEIIRRLLRPGGSLYLFYSPPSPAKIGTLAEQLVTTLAGLGFPGAIVETATAGSSPVFFVRAG